MEKIKALCVIAHPDDETIWMGGFILKHRYWDWFILCLCRKGDSDREPKFKKVCSYYGARCIIDNLDDEKLNPINIKEIEKRILKNLKKKNFDFIFTHGKNGEYGHIRHKEIHLAIKNLIKDKKVLSKNIRYFSYSGKIPSAKDSKFSIKLPKKIYEEKLKVISNLYGFDKNSFEFLCCKEKEAFEK